MTTVKIPYAKDHLVCTLSDDRLIGILESKAHHQNIAGKTQEDIVQRALEEPIGTLKLSELAKGKKNIVIITSDHTRPVPSHVISPLLVREIRKGSPDAEITFLIATGFHRASSKAELIYKFGERFLNEINVVMHDCQNDRDMVKIGTLPSGGELVINKLVMEADLLVAEGFIEPHFFAGFSGGRKSVLPGVVSKVTVLANHCAKFIASDKAIAGNLKGNPLHIDMLFAAQQAKLAFILNVVINAEKEIIKAYAGDLIMAHEAGCQFVRELASVNARPADIVITSNGGYPLDQNIYQAVKGMSAAARSVNPGGVIIICAACNDGHGGDDFYQWFKAAAGPEEVLDKIMQIAAKDTLPDQWQAQILAKIQLKAHVIIVTDQCEHAMIEQMHMKAAATLQEAMSLAEAIAGNKAKITVIPDGVSVIVN